MKPRSPPMDGACSKSVCINVFRSGFTQLGEVCIYKYLGDSSREFWEMPASTEPSRRLSHCTNSPAETGLTSVFGTGTGVIGFSLLWPAGKVND